MGFLTGALLFSLGTMFGIAVMCVMQVSGCDEK